LALIAVPESVVSIGEDIISGAEQAVIACGFESAILIYADEHSLQYIVVDH